MREAHLRDFIAVVETGSVRAAARRLELTQGAVSKNLTALEREYGVPLLVRSTRGVELTDFGRILLRRARLADTELRKAVEEIAAHSGDQRGVINVGLSSTAEALLAAPAIERFRQQRPDTMVCLQGGMALTMVSMLREGKLDFAVAPASPASVGSDLHAERLLSTDLVVIARDSHPAAQATSLEELVGYEWIVGTRLEDKSEPSIVSVFREAELPLPVFSVQRDSFSALIYLLLQTDQLAIATQPSVLPFCRCGMLTIVPLQLQLPSPAQYLLTSANRPLTPNATLLAAEFRRARRAYKR
ncbi:MAG: LysR family transcriptional regulator [Rhizobacter sp.]|nr:LysR family transcriptional regulator [Rhizobacter sp.]